MKKMYTFLVFLIFQNNLIFSAQRNNRMLDEPCFKVAGAALSFGAIIAIAGMISYGKKPTDIGVVWLWSSVVCAVSSGFCIAAAVINNCRERAPVAVQNGENV